MVILRACLSAVSCEFSGGDFVAAQPAKHAAHRHHIHTPFRRESNAVFCHRDKISIESMRPNKLKLTDSSFDDGTRRVCRATIRFLHLSCHSVGIFRRMTLEKWQSKNTQLIEKTVYFLSVRGRQRARQASRDIAAQMGK
jgi:hypothetical protein